MTRKGVWNLQQTRDKYLQSLWANDINLYGWGKNQNGTLGINTRDTVHPGYSSPIQIGTNTNWRSFSGKAGGTTSAFMMATKTDGTLWTWGQNRYGQLGQNGNELSSNGISSPTQVGSGTDWSNEISRGVQYAVAIKTDGTLWGWGQNQQGQLGQNIGTAVADRSSPVQVPGTTWSKAYAAGSFTAAIKTNGELWMWGYQNKGNLGQNQGGTARYSSPVQVPGTTWDKADVGNSHTLAIKTDGTLWAWGDGGGGALGQNQPNTAHYSSPVQIPGTNWKNCYGGGANRSAAINTDGELFIWGPNAKGDLGQNQNQSALDNASSPIQITGTTWDKFSWITNGGWRAIKTDGTLWGCGKFTNGAALYNDAPDDGISSPVQIGSDARWDSITSWGYGTHALRATLTPSQL